MLRPVLTGMTVVALALAGAPATQAQVAPDRVASARIAPTSVAPAAVRVPSAVSPRIGYVYGAGLTSTGMGVTVYAQQADGSLTRIQDVLTGDSVHSIVIVRLTSGRALYDLTRTGLFAFHINPVTGLLTPFAVPKPTSPVNAVNGLGAYDPLAHGQAGQPMLVTGACGAPAGGFTCPFRFETFLVNPVTGALSAGTLGPVSTVQLGAHIVGDGLGRFAFGAATSTPFLQITFARAGVVAGKTVLTSAGAHTVADNAGGLPPVRQWMGTSILITRSALVEFYAGVLQIFPDHPAGWVAYGFGSSSAAPYESRVDAEVTAAVEGRKYVYVGERGGTIPGGGCAIEAFGPVDPGLGGVWTPVACAGSPNTITAMFEQGSYLYVGRYQETSLGFHDAAATTLTPTGQGTVPLGSQIYSWAGFLFGNPTVAVPAKVTGPAGIPVTIGCQQTCAGSTSALVKIAGVAAAIKVPVVTIKAHAAGTFVVKILLSTTVRAKITAAIKAKKKVSATTTTKIVAGVHSVSIVKVSTFTA